MSMPEVTGDNTASRRRAYAVGHLAEKICRLVLRLKGYRILERRYRHQSGEIDIIAHDGDMLVFVEVKARRNYADAAEAVSARNRRRVASAAAAFLMQHPGLSELPVRFDVMLVTPWALPHHIQDAWQMPAHPGMI